jgi:HSP20 family protein
MTSLEKKENTLPSLMSDFFDYDKFFGNRWFERETNQSLPAVNIQENAKEFNIEFAVPGFNKNDFKINIETNVLTISAEKKEEKKEENSRFTRREFNYNTFSRSFTLPQSVDTETINAKYTDGILKLQIPKKEEAKKTTKKEIKLN